MPSRLSIYSNQCQICQQIFFKRSMIWLVGYFRFHQELEKNTAGNHFILYPQHNQKVKKHILMINTCIFKISCVCLKIFFKYLERYCGHFIRMVISLFMVLFLGTLITSGSCLFSTPDSGSLIFLCF